jgi:tRNA G18 (ribose-2'-O)-methylase SpoU
LAVGKRAPIPTFLEGLDATFGGENSEITPVGEIGSGTRFLSRRGGAFVVLPDATKPDNLGLAFRCAAALGAEAVVLGERCCDPFSRRALRVSMGGVLQTPIFRAENLLDEIAEARRRRGVRFFATVLNDEAASLPEIDAWPERTAFVFGNEYSGLTPEFVDACDRSVMIPMRPDVDSLNLGVSVGVFLYEFNRARSRRAANG